MRKLLLASVSALALAISPASAQFNGASGIYALNGQTFGLTSTWLKIVSGGTGYAPGDVVSLTCPAIGAANKTFGTVTVGSVSSGAITSVAITTSGNYTALPSSGDASAINGVCTFVQASTSGSGSGAVISTLLAFNAAPNATTYVGPLQSGYSTTLGLGAAANSGIQAGYNTALGLGSAANYTASVLAPSVLQFGADPTGAVDSTPAFTAAKVAFPGGGKIRIPCGKYLITGFVNDVPGLTFEGDNQQCVRIANTSTSSVAWTITAYYANLYNVTFWPTVRNSAPQVKITGLAAFWVGLRDVEAIYGGGISYVNGPNQGWFQRVQARSLLSGVGLDYEGTAAAQALGLTIDDSVFDNPWPIAEPNGLFTTWAATHAMAAGAVVDVNGVLWQAAASCTTGSTAPSGLPSGTTPESVFTNTIADGTCNWYWVASDGLYMIYNNSYGRSLFIHDSAFVDGAIGIAFTDTINDGGSWPEFTRFSNVTTDSNLYSGMTINAGADLRIVNGFYASVGYGTGVFVGAAFRGDLTISGSIIANNYADGLDINGGVQNFHITDNSISSNGMGAGVWNNINVLGKGVVGFSGFSGGSGYSSTPTVNVSGGGGSGAVVSVAYMSGGSVGALVINTRGSGYTSAPAISFSGGGGSGAAVTAVLGGPSGGSITNNSTGVSQIFASQIPTASYGLLLSAVPSDYLTVTGNYCGIGATLACFLNQSTGTHNYVPAGANN